MTHINETPARPVQGRCGKIRPRRKEAMLTFEDCLGFCELSEEEIRVIAEHEHLPQIVALEFGNYLMCGPDGELQVSRMLFDDIRAAERRGDLLHAAKLKRALRRFIEQRIATHRPCRAP